MQEFSMGFENPLPVQFIVGLKSMDFLIF